MGSSDVIAVMAISTSSIIALMSPWLAYRLASRQEHTRWFRESKLQMYENAMSWANEQETILRDAIKDTLPLRGVAEPVPPELATRLSLYASASVKKDWDHFVIVRKKIARDLPIEQGARDSAQSRVIAATTLLLGAIREDIQDPMKLTNWPKRKVRR